MLSHNIGRLPVVSRQNPRHLVGYLGRSGALAVWLRRFEAEQIREPDWLNYPFRKPRKWNILRPRAEKWMK